MNTGKLTVRQRRFARHYVECGVGAEAARRAGYAPGSADVAAARLLGNARIQEAVQAVAAAQGDTPGAVLSELRDLGAGAVAAKQYGPAVRAAELRGRAVGLWAEASTGTGRVIVNIFDSRVTFGGDGDSDQDAPVVIDGEAAQTEV